MDAADFPDTPNEHAASTQKEDNDDSIKSFLNKIKGVKRTGVDNYLSRPLTRSRKHVG